MEEETAIAIVPTALPSIEDVAAAADHVASAHRLDDYHKGLSKETIRRQKADLALFVTFLQEAAQITPGDLFNDLAAWRSITYGLLAAFLRWQEAKGYALSSINVRLATLKAYCKLAHDAEMITTEAYTRIQGVKGYKGARARHIDEKRETTRIGRKKAQWVSISPAHAELLKRAPTGPLSERDRLLLCLLLDHALRIGEAAILKVADINLAAGTLHVSRPKTGIEDTNELTPDTLAAAHRYLATLPPGQLLVFDGLSTRALFYRVNHWASEAGIEHFSPHDCRHYFAEDATRNGTDLKTLRDAGGWKTLEMPARYAGRQKIANAGIKLSALKKTT
jgi:integrase